MVFFVFDLHTAHASPKGFKNTAQSAAIFDLPFTGTLVLFLLCVVFRLLVLVMRHPF